jgi:hypothetical protein
LVNSIQVHAGQEGVVVAEPAGQRLGQVRDLGARPSLSQLGQRRPGRVGQVTETAAQFFPADPVLALVLRAYPPDDPPGVVVEMVECPRGHAVPEVGNGSAPDGAAIAAQWANGWPRVVAAFAAAAAG